MIGGIEYASEPQLAPSQELFDRFTKEHRPWSWYEKGFRAPLRERKVEQLNRKLFDRACLLCSEPTADHCHRRLVSEYLGEKWGRVHVTHL